MPCCIVSGSVVSAGCCVGGGQAIILVERLGKGVGWSAGDLTSEWVNRSAKWNSVSFVVRCDIPMCYVHNVT